jgi:RHS repeat-associated protein
MAGRGFSSAAYRYGFNDKEKEADGTADNYDFGARIYDGRLGRWLSTDQFKRIYLALSPYNFVKNAAILFIDPTGNIIEPTEGFKRSKSRYGALKTFNNTQVGNQILSRFASASDPIVQNTQDGDLAKHSLKLSKVSASYNPASSDLFVKVNGTYQKYSSSMTIDETTIFQVNVNLSGGSKTTADGAYLIGHELLSHIQHFVDAASTFNQDVEEANKLTVQADKDAALQAARVKYKKVLDENFGEKNTTTATKKDHETIEKEKDNADNLVTKCYNQLKEHFKDNKKELKALEATREIDTTPN